MASMRPPISQKLLLHRPTRPRVDLRGKRVVLTGASSGIGEAAAELFADEGATVVVVARRRGPLEGLAQRITARGGSAFALPCNLSDLAAVDDLVKTLQGRIS